MKLTIPLLSRGRIIKMQKEQWRAVKRRTVPDDYVPETLLQKAIDARKLTEPGEKLIVETPIVRRTGQDFICTTKNLDKNVCHVYNRWTHVIQGVAQAQLLTNSIVKKEFPSQIEALLGVCEQENQDEVVKRIVLLSNVYDGHQVRLPKVVDVTKRHIKFPRVYGTPLKQKIGILVRNLVRNMDLQSQSSGSAIQRTHFLNMSAILNTKQNNDLIQYNVKSDLMITSSNPLAPFADEIEVASIQGSPLPDLYPMKYTINLAKRNNHERIDFYSLDKNEGHIHSLYLYNLRPRTNWNSEEILADALITCNAFAVTRARRQYGVETTKLPHPITLQCVHTDGRLFSFIFYQLNTLETSFSSSERNIFWIVPDVPLYSRCEEKDGVVFFEGYNSDIYENLLAMHLNGMTLNSQPNLSELVKMKRESVNKEMQALP